MKVTVSSKHQVVIPKALRQQVGIRAGQRLNVEANKHGDVVIKKDAASNIDALIDKYAGIARGAWGPDPVATIRKMRDEDWG